MTAIAIRKLAQWTRETGRTCAAQRIADALDAIADTHPKDGDVKQAPLVSGGGGVANRPKDTA